MIAASSGSRGAISRRDTTNSGEMAKRISSCTQPCESTPPPRHRLAKSACSWLESSILSSLALTTTSPSTCSALPHHSAPLRRCDTNRRNSIGRSISSRSPLSMISLMRMKYSTKHCSFCTLLGCVLRNRPKKLMARPRLPGGPFWKGKMHRKPAASSEKHCSAVSVTQPRRPGMSAGTAVRKSRRMASTLRHIWGMANERNRFWSDGGMASKMELNCSMVNRLLFVRVCCSSMMNWRRLLVSGGPPLAYFLTISQILGHLAPS
mmetsp:Transcript_14236/g.40932  ORF Transcript_14236/g.40932 Transcript_14236/m.40932 type:complete len:264 (-) Transcript_14236:103-894(-)